MSELRVVKSFLEYMTAGLEILLQVCRRVHFAFREPHQQRDEICQRCVRAVTEEILDGNAQIGLQHVILGNVVNDNNVLQALADVTKVFEVDTVHDFA